VTSLEWIAGRDWHRSTVSGGGAQSSQWNRQLAMYDDQKICMAGVVQFILDVNSGRF
jgi:hypothetical protein